MRKRNQSVTILIFFFSITMISFLTKFLSEWTHEFLGHIGFGYLVGGNPVEFKVAWLWPLKFGYAIVHFESSATNAARAVTKGGGIIMCLFMASISQLSVYYLEKTSLRNNWFGEILFHTLFWYGFWAFTNSVGYLLVGSILSYGDIADISYYSGISVWIFTIPGFIFFSLFYYIISINCFHLFYPFVSLQPKWLIFLFWWVIPILYILFYLNPDIIIQIPLFVGGFLIMLIPSLFSYFTIQHKWKFWTRLYPYPSLK